MQANVATSICHVVKLNKPKNLHPVDSSDKALVNHNTKIIETQCALVGATRFPTEGKFAEEKTTMGKQAIDGILARNHDSKMKI